MKVLFVSSGNSKNGISSIVKAQGDSLYKKGISIEYFTIQGKGISGYFKNIFILHSYLKKHHFDLIHAHYSLSGICAALSGARPLVVSLMGSDVHQSKILALIIRFFSKYVWKSTIVKSEEMKKKLGLKNVYIVPNGVDFEKFEPIEKEIAQKKVNFNPKKKNVIFVANPSRIEKNYSLAFNAVNLLNDNNVILHTVYDLPHAEIVNYMYAADVLLLTSLWEGSPNVIKEAMVCNCPIVTVPVGDVKDVIRNTSGCFISSYDTKDLSEKLGKSLTLSNRTNGRNSIIEMGLDAKTVAANILNIYSKALSE